ncbi:MAG: hypothetical protein Q4E36_04275 [Bacillota bacterium]|nr:hypothetical protein [Bacillota bacterium]
MFKSQKNFSAKKIISLLLLLSMIIGIFLFWEKNPTKIELSNLSSYSFEELYKTKELIGIDTFYNSNADLEDIYFLTLDLNFKNKQFEYLDYTYLFFDGRDVFEQKVDITRQGKLIFPRKEASRLRINYKSLPSFYEIEDMLLSLEQASWIEFFNVSDEDDIDFNFVGLIKNNEDKLNNSDVYFLKDNKIQLKDSNDIFNHKEIYYLWTVRIKDEINYLCI